MCRKSVKVVLTALITASMLPASAALSAEREIVISVLDANKAPVTELSPSDIVIREDGVAREVLRVRKATAPLTIALLVDDSAAASPAIADIRNGLLAFFDELKGAHDVALITFGDRSTLVVDYTRDQERLKQAVRRLHARQGAGAYFLDALSDAARGLEKREPERPVIVSIMTEGVEFSTDAYQTVLRRLEASGATFHALVITGAEANQAADEMRNRNLVLDEGTRGTGGRRDLLLSSIGVRSALRELAADLQNQWVVTYSRPDALIPPERIQAEAKREGLTVRGRTKLPPARTTK